MGERREWLDKLLFDKSLTHLDVADSAGVERAYITQIVNGDRTPSPKVAKKIASFVGCDWTKFFEQERGKEVGYSGGTDKNV